MASQTVTITFTADWHEETPTGANCMACGDGCYLEQWRLVMACGKTTMPTEYVLCAACAAMLAEAECGCEGEE